MTLQTLGLQVVLRKWRGKFAKYDFQQDHRWYFDRLCLPRRGQCSKRPPQRFVSGLCQRFKLNSWRILDHANCSPSGLYSDRTFSGHRDYCHFDCAAVASRVTGSRSGTPLSVQRQPQADRTGNSHLRRDSQVIPRRHLQRGSDKSVSGRKYGQK